MATLGSAGANKNFAPEFTVPAAQTLVGYACGQYGGVKVYRSVDIKRNVPGTKFAAVRAAAAALNTKIILQPGGWPMNVPAAKGFRLFLSHPARGNAPAAAANVQILLDNIETAITT